MFKKKKVKVNKKGRKPLKSRHGSDLFNFKLTQQGMVMTGAVSVVAGFVVMSPAFHLLAAIFTVYILTYFFGTIFSPKLTVKGHLPERMESGREITVRYELTNNSKKNAYDVAVGLFNLPSQLKQIKSNDVISCIVPGETVYYDMYVKPLRRGMYEVFAPRYYSTFPFNMFRNGPLNVKELSILVIPSYCQIEHLRLSPDSRYCPGGVTSAVNVGESPEYIGNREYRSGDSPRRIDCRAWARLGAPAVKEYNEEYFCHVAIVLDTQIHSRKAPGPEGYPEFEAAMSLAASLVDSISRSEDIIDVFAAGAELYVFRTGRNTAQFDTLLEVLACLEYSKFDPFESLSSNLVKELGNTSSVVFILMDWNDSREQLVKSALEHGCMVKIILIGEGKYSKDYRQYGELVGAVYDITPEMVKLGKLDFN